MTDRGALDPFLGASDCIRRLADLAHKVASGDAPVLLQGETGTGKGTIARWLHHNGPRVLEPFVDLNCGAFSGDLLETELLGGGADAAGGASQGKAGLLEIAHKGTVFLDEIENVAIEAHPTLLKVVEEKQVRRIGEVSDRRSDIRLIAATEQLMAPPVVRKPIRDDLRYRINWIHLFVPPLRERLEDISTLSRAHPGGPYRLRRG